MVHSLRKYLSNRGSALFMVISTMTALMITCMAMYFAVVSSRSAGFAVFNQQQSYQSSVSIAEMTVGNLSDILIGSGVSIDSVPVGGTILTTDGNGYKALNPNADSDDDHYLGAYDVTLTRLADETFDGETYFTIDIAVTTSVNDVKEIFHQVVNVIQEGGTPNQKGKIFASTGYVPNDSFLSKGSFYSDVYVSNEDTVIGAFSGTEIHFYSNIYCENSLSLLDYVNIKNYAAGPIIHAVRGNYNIGMGDGIDIKGDSYILVGGDMHLARAFNSASNDDVLEVYVGGDLYLENGAQNLNSNRLKFYVAGDVIVNTTGNGAIPGVVYCRSFKFRDGYSLSNYNRAGNGEWEEGLDWESDKDNRHGSGSRQMRLTFSEAMKMLDSKTPNIQYKLWKLDETKLASSIGKVTDSGTLIGGEEREIVFHSINNQSMYEPVELKYGVDGIGCIIKNIRIDGGGNNTPDKIPTLIIDTGDSPDNTYVIRLQNNTVSPKGTSYFTWQPKDAFGNLCGPMQLLVKGNGSLVIDVPEGVVYQDADNVRVAHYNWYMLTNGSGLQTQDGRKYYTTNQGAFLGATLSPYVHSSCTEGDGCVYTEEGRSPEPCESCGGPAYIVSCSLHEEYTICPSCEPEYFTSTDPENPVINPVGVCKDRVKKQKCIDALRAIDSASRPVNKDSSGEIIVPNCNIFLVSCSESAEFRFGRTIDDVGPVAYNCFAGFIYAPYMSYKANGSDLGDFILHMGGMVVSDYKFLSKNSFIACWPSVYPPQGVLDEESLSSTLSPLSEKRYRVKLKAAY